MTSPILLARDGFVATLTLTPPASLNALDPTVMDARGAHTAALAADTSLRCVVIQGSGRHFMAGGDIRNFAEQLELAPGERQQRFTRMIGRLHAAIEHLQRMPHPVLASVHGAVAGFGLSLLCACDLAIAAEGSYFTAAYRQLGLTPDGGLSYALPRLVGPRRAMEILLLGERFGVAAALRAARDGANIVIAAKTTEPNPKLPGTIHSAAAEIERAGGAALPLQVDIRNEAAVQRAVELASTRFGGIDILVNNASAISLTGTLATPMKRFDLMFGVNV